MLCGWIATTRIRSSAGNPNKAPEGGTRTCRERDRLAAPSRSSDPCLSVQALAGRGFVLALSRQLVHALRAASTSAKPEPTLSVRAQ